MPRQVLAVEPLEDRCLLAVFTVTTTADTGPESLRQAILDANAKPGPDRIEFAINSGPQTIRPSSALPGITDSAYLDGTTQPGYQGTPLIEVDGSSVSRASGLSLGGPGGSTVRALVINRFGGPTDVAGISMGSNNRIVGNYIGTDLTGTRSLGNRHGLLVGSDNIIGGTAPEDRNLISGNVNLGIWILGSRNVVQGNFIGTEVTGTKPLGNRVGVSLSQSIGGSGVSFNLIGGTELGAGNVLSGNRGSGISSSGTIQGGSPQDNFIVGNFIGTDVTGTQPLGNTGDGAFFIQYVSSTTLASNLIGFNGGHGVFSVLSNRNAFEANAIFGNAGDGIRIRAGTSNRVGGTDEGEGNMVAYNGGNGIVVDLSQNNALRGNSLFGNVGGGITLLNGANFDQPAPELTAAVSLDGSLTVSGWLYSRGRERFQLDFFASPSCHESSYGEGELFLGARAVETDADWFASFEELFEADVPAGWVVTATATDGYGNTSAFSNCAEVQKPGGPGAGPTPGALVPLDAAVLAALTTKRTDAENRWGA